MDFSGCKYILDHFGVCFLYFGGKHPCKRNKYGNKRPRLFLFHLFPSAFPEYSQYKTKGKVFLKCNAMVEVFVNFQ